jgi:peptide/nickel transport system ATP-binding protein
MPKILEIQNLSLGFHNRVLVDTISFEIHQGQILGIVGESGSGKSLTALSIINLLPRDIKVIAGEILYTSENKSFNLLSLDAKNIRGIRGKRIAMIFQEPMTSLNPSMQCGVQVEECIKAHYNFTSKEIHNKVLELLTEVLLPNPEQVFKKFPHQLSGGQRQRIMIAMALSADPEIIIADEPTTALDVTIQKSIIDLLNTLCKKRNLSLIFISHDLRLVRGFADEVIVMRNGKIIEKGPVNNLFLNPSTQYTKGLIACLPPLNKRPYRLLTIRDFEQGNSTHVSERTTSRPVVQYTKEPLLKIENLTVSYSHRTGIFFSGKRTTKALDTISFEVFRGETLGLVGESGCGKTTIGKTILKLIQFGDGEIWYKGKKINALKGNELSQFRKSVQVVFQDPFSSLNPKHKINEMLNESLKVHHPRLSNKRRLEKISDLLLKVGLSESDMFKYPHQFSGGQRQRITIARSLTPEPEFLVLDESVSALDVSVQAQVLNLLNDLKDIFGLTYLFISHDLSVVKYMADRIVIMNTGKIEEIQNSERIFSEPGTDYTKKLIRAIPGYQNSL